MSHITKDKIYIPEPSSVLERLSKPKVNQFLPLKSALKSDNGCGIFPMALLRNWTYRKKLAIFFCTSICKLLKGATSGLRTFSANESPLKMQRNASYFTLNALLVLKPDGSNWNGWRMVERKFSASLIFLRIITFFIKI